MVRTKEMHYLDYNKANRHKSRAPSLQRQTDQTTDRQTDRPTEWLIESRARD